MKKILIKYLVIIIMALWFCFVGFFIWQSNDLFWCLDLNEFGDLLAGVIAPIALCWFIIELSNNRKETKLLTEINTLDFLAKAELNRPILSYVIGSGELKKARIDKTHPENNTRNVYTLNFRNSGGRIKTIIFSNILLSSASLSEAIFTNELSLIHPAGDAEGLSYVIRYWLNPERANSTAKFILEYEDCFQNTFKLSGILGTEEDNRDFFGYVEKYKVRKEINVQQM